MSKATAQQKKRVPAIDVRDVPGGILAAVDAEARERDVSLNDVIGEILARRYGLPWRASEYPYSGTNGSDQWLVRIPQALHAAVKGHADGAGLTMRGCVLLALSDHYGLEPVSPRKRTTYSIDPDIIREAREAHAAGESLRSLSRRYGIKRETLTKAIRAGA